MTHRKCKLEYTVRCMTCLCRKAIRKASYVIQNVVPGKLITYGPLTTHGPFRSGPSLRWYSRRTIWCTLITYKVHEAIVNNHFDGIFSHQVHLSRLICINNITYPLCVLIFEVGDDLSHHLVYFLCDVHLCNKMYDQGRTTRR